MVTGDDCPQMAQTDADKDRKWSGFPNHESDESHESLIDASVVLRSAKERLHICPPLTYH